MDVGHQIQHSIILIFSNAIFCPQDDPLDVFVELSRRILEIDPTPGTCMPASFQHMASGYDARYYGYMVCCFIDY